MARIQKSLTIVLTAALAVSLFASFAAGAEAVEPTSNEIGNAVDNVESYEYETVINTTTVTVTDGERQETHSQSEGDGAVNLTEGELREAITSETSGDEAQINGEIESQTYLVNGTYYTATTTPSEETQWIQIDAPESEAFTMGPLAQHTALLNTSNITSADKTELNGTDTYMLELTVDLDEYQEEMSAEFGAANTSNDADVDTAAADNINQSIQELTVTMWVDTETYLPVKSEITTEICFDDLGDGNVTAENATTNETGSIDRSETTSTQTTYFKNYNEPVDITLPEEAEDAQTLEEQLEEVDVSSGSSTDNESLENDVNEDYQQDASEEELDNLSNETTTEDTAEDGC